MTQSGNEINFQEYLNYKFRVKNDKIHLIPRDGNGKHITIHLGLKSKIIDVHETTYENNKPNYNTILAIRHFTLGRIITEFKKNFLDVAKILFSRRITVAQMHRCGYLLQQVENVNPELIFDFSKSKSVISPKKSIQRHEFEKLFIEPNEIRNVSSQSLFLVHAKKNGREFIKGAVLSHSMSKPTDGFTYISRELLERIVDIHWGSIIEMIRSVFDLQRQNETLHKLRDQLGVEQ